MLVDLFSKSGVLPTGTWRALSEHFAPYTTTSVTDPETFTPRKEPGRGCSDRSAPDGRHQAGALEDCQVFLYRTSYTVTSLPKEAAA